MSLSQKSSKHQNAVLTIVLTSYLIIILDVSVVLTGLPKIHQEFSFSEAELSWVQSAYTLAFGGLLLLGARAGDILGRRRMFVAGMAVFTASSVAIGAAPSAEFLLAARALQGIGAAMLAPSTLALLSAAFPEGPGRTRAVALYGSVAGIGTSIGMVLGGILADAISWRVGFLIILPIGVAMIVAARRYLVETELHVGRFDILGAVSSTLGMTGLVFALVRSADLGWSDAYVICSLTVGLILSFAFIAVERSAAQPIMPMRILWDRTRAGAYLARLLFMGAMVGFYFFVTQFLQIVEGFTPLEAGIGFLPVTLIGFLTALAVPRLTRLFGNARLLVGGLALGAIGMAWLAHVSAANSYLSGIAFPMILVGIGQGCSLGPLTVAGIAGVEQRDAGAASGMVNVAHQIGGCLGLSILVAISSIVGSTATDSVERIAVGSPPASQSELSCW